MRRAVQGCCSLAFTRGARLGIIWHGSMVCLPSAQVNIRPLFYSSKAYLHCILISMERMIWWPARVERNFVQKREGVNPELTIILLTQLHYLVKNYNMSRDLCRSPLFFYPFRIMHCYCLSMLSLSIHWQPWLDQRPNTKFWILYNNIIIKWIRIHLDETYT